MGKLFTKCKVRLVAFSVIFIIIGATFFLYIPKLIFNQIAEHAYLGRDSNGTYNELLKNYVNPPYYMQLEIWTLSVANADSVVKNGSKPLIIEKGPYTFVETQNKIVRFKDNTNDTRLYYRNNRHYFFNQTLSCSKCHLSDQVTVPSIVFQKIVDFAQGKNFALREMIDILLRYENETAYIEVNVGDLLFNGYEDSLLKKVCNYKKVLQQICKSAGVPDRIGLFYQKNNTDDGLYEIDTGRFDVLNLGHVYAWNGMTGKLNASYWFADEARMINGTDSQLFAPKILLKRENFQIFAGQACRSVELEFQEPTDVLGLSANRYIPAKSMGDMKLQKEMGFCMPKTPTFFADTKIQEPGCLPTGLMDMGGCVLGAPRIYVSNAHFLDSPAAVRFAVEGIAEPDTNNDNTFVDIEPLTGVIVRAQHRSQINVGVLRGNLKYD